MPIVGRRRLLLVVRLVVLSMMLGILLLLLFLLLLMLVVAVVLVMWQLVVLSWIKVVTLQQCRPWPRRRLLIGIMAADWRNAAVDVHVVSSIGCCLL